jgi:hypothetical protein
MFSTRYIYCILYPYCDRIATLHRKETLRRSLEFVFNLSIVAPHCAAVFWKLCRDDVVNDVDDDDDDAAKTCRMMLFV